MITEERRDRWECCQVLHGGDGPETSSVSSIFSVRSCTAAEAAQTYAEERMGDVDNERDYGNGDCMYVAVRLAHRLWQVHRCYKVYDVTIHAHPDAVRENLTAVRI